MSTEPSPVLTPRHQRELEYHRRYAARFTRAGLVEVALDVVDPVRRRWWNAYWHAWTRLFEAGPRGNRALVVGCGFGDDAIRLAWVGARGSAFDLSPESLGVALGRAAAAGVPAIDFRQMACERLHYPDRTFEIVFAVDILHHADIPATLRELSRVAADGCVFVCNEPYTHRLLARVRRTEAVERWVYSRCDRRDAGGLRQRHRGAYRAGAAAGGAGRARLPAPARSGGRTGGGSIRRMRAAQAEALSLRRTAGSRKTSADSVRMMADAGDSKRTAGFPWLMARARRSWVSAIGPRMRPMRTGAIGKS